MTSKSTASKHTYTGLFMVALATLIYEIHLTRIFSITMWYHFAFVAISVTMFGMTVGALLVYLLPNYFNEERTKTQLAQSAMWFGLTIVLSFLAHVIIPFQPALTIAGLLSVGLTYAVISVPFVFSGICTCLALTRFPLQVSKLYAADLAGAATGCLAFIGLLNIVDGATAVIVIALLASFAAYQFAAEPDFRGSKRPIITSLITLAVFAVLHWGLAAMGKPILQFARVKVGVEPPALHAGPVHYCALRTVRHDEEPHLSRAGAAGRRFLRPRAGAPGRLAL